MKLEPLSYKDVPGDKGWKLKKQLFPFSSVVERADERGRTPRNKARRELQGAWTLQRGVKEPLKRQNALDLQTQALDWPRETLDLELKIVHVLLITVKMCYQKTQLSGWSRLLPTGGWNFRLFSWRFLLFIAIQPVVDLFTGTVQKTLSDAGDSKAFQKKECLMSNDILTSSQI